VITPAAIIGRIWTELRAAEFIAAERPIEQETQGGALRPLPLEVVLLEGLVEDIACRLHRHRLMDDRYRAGVAFDLLTEFLVRPGLRLPRPREISPAPSAPAAARFTVSSWRL
jgi:hypothetical protein